MSFVDGPPFCNVDSNPNHLIRKLHFKPIQPSAEPTQGSESDCQMDSDGLNQISRSDQIEADFGPFVNRGIWPHLLLEAFNAALEAEQI